MNEDLSPVEELLDELSITYDIVEIRKQSPARVLDLEDGQASVPEKGVAVLNESDAHAILASFGKPESQATSQYTGLPQPIQVQRQAGETEIETLASQVYLLSQSHIGAISATARLPITTHYADRPSEAAAEGYLPSTSRLRNNMGFL
jgi:argonaute-like protein implicated in RNA metabolism and viral defense